jgi:hypothetical protein
MAYGGLVEEFEVGIDIRKIFVDIGRWAFGFAW